MTQGHQLHGYGPNSFYSYKPYTVTAFRTYVSDNKEQSTVHNYFLLLWVEQGIPGVLIFLMLLFGLFYLANRWYHGTDDKTEKVISATIASILSMIVTLNLLSDLIETDKIGGLFFICTGILMLANVNGKVFWKMKH
jgi:O-antigen ligase